MITAVYVLAYLAGAVAVAFWVDRRFPRIARAIRGRAHGLVVEQAVDANAAREVAIDDPIVRGVPRKALGAVRRRSGTATEEEE